MKKRVFAVAVLAMVFVLLSAVIFVACSPDTNPGTENTVLTDDEYTLTLRGLVDSEGNPLADIIITKAQLKALFLTHPVTYTEEEPCYASDKQDDDGNLIPHSIEGVYLEDVLAEYTDSDVIDAYGSMGLYATDTYFTLLTEETFNSTGRGSKMIIALSYDGIQLNVNEKSGALRAVFPDQIMNAWAKKLQLIEFSTEILATPQANRLYFFETLGNACNGQYTITEEVEGGNTAEFTYYGKSIAELIEAGILNAISTDKMHLSAWDYNSETEKYTAYSAWTKYEIYSVGYLLNEYEREDEGVEPLTRAPVFDGPTFSSGMTVKNILAVSVFNSAVVSLSTAFERFDTNTDNSIWVKDILILLNMYEEDNEYTITMIDDTTADLTAEEIFTASLQKEGDGYNFVYGSESATIKRIAIKIS